MWFLILFGLVAAQRASGVIYNLSPLEYEKLPTFLDIDEYEPCMRGPGDVYCFVSVQLYGNESDPLYNTLVEYSENTIKHFNHTHLHRGVCPKLSCQKHMNSSFNVTEVIEACLNETLTTDYRLTSKVFAINCEQYHETTEFDAADYAFGAVVLTILGLNLLGTLYDINCQHGKDTRCDRKAGSFLAQRIGIAIQRGQAASIMGILASGGKYLLSFSVRLNWRRLAAPPSSEPYQRRLRSLFALKTLTSVMVVAAHVGVPTVFMSRNPIFLEKAYDSWVFLLLINGPVVVQIFFLSSALLLAYNKLKGERKKPTSWQDLPKDVFDRWLRLTPVYALLTFYVMTWARHSGSSPFSQKALQTEADSCWENWWRHILYIDNYKDNSRCMIHAWYVAADFQLSVLGIMVFSLLSSNRTRKLAIGAALIVGLLTPAAHVYFQNLPAVLLVTPELVFNFFVTDPAFNDLYKRGHTNIGCYALGLGFAYILFNLKESDIEAQKYKKYRTLYWLLGPIMIAVISCGMVFYVDGIVVPIGVRMVYSGSVRVLFGILVSTLIFFTTVKVDRSLRGFFDWPGWARISRLTYCAYLIHVPLLRLGCANTSTMVHGSLFYHIHNYLAFLTMSFILALPLHVLVEAPLGEFTRLFMYPAQKKTKPPTLVAESKETVEVKL